MDLIETIRAVVECRSEVDVCILFGSAATGELTAESDIDIALCGERSFGADSLVEIGLELESRLGRAVDILDLARLDGLILREVLSTGRKILNRRPELLAHHIKRMLFYSADMYPLYRRMVRSRLKRFVHER